MRRVLVLEDDVTIAELMRIVLAEGGYDVHVAVAERDVPEGDFDCIVTDLMSVGAYGLEAARAWILRLADRFPSVPVIVVTAHAEAGLDGAALGAAAVIMKPFDVDQITQAVREATT